MCKDCHFFYTNYQIISLFIVSKNLTFDVYGITVPNNRGDHPVERNIHLPRQARRLLGATGAVSSRVPHLRTEAADAALRLWEQCDRQQTVVWLDN